MTKSAEVSDPLTEASGDDLPNDARPNLVALEERQGAVEESRTGYPLPHVDSDDEFVVTSENAALLRRPPYSKNWLCTIREGWYAFGDLAVWLSTWMLKLFDSFGISAY